MVYNQCFQKKIKSLVLMYNCGSQKSDNQFDVVG